MEMLVGGRRIGSATGSKTETSGVLRKI